MSLNHPIEHENESSLLPDSDPEGTRKLQDACAGLSMGSRVLLQFSTTLNPDSPFYGKDFDPEGRQAALRIAETMPVKLKEEIANYGKGTIEERAAKSTELALNLFTFAQTGELSIGKVGQLAKDSKLVSDINSDIRVFGSRLKELNKDKLDDLACFVEEKCQIAPKPAYDGPSMHQGPGSDASRVLEMRKYFDDSSPRRGSDKAAEARQVRENRKLREALELETIMKEGFKTKEEAGTVKYLRDKGEVITKNPREGDGSSQTDAMEWELKHMSKTKQSCNIVDRIAAHAKNGSMKNTGDAHLGRVLIDARRQGNLSETIAIKGMKEAMLRSPSLKEIRIVGESFDIGLKRGPKEHVKRW